MDFKAITKNIWEIYFFGNKDGSDTGMKLIAPDCIIIGTGKHEFYRSMEEFAKAFSKGIAERQDIQFWFKDFWCEEKEISPDAVLVYGGLFACWESEDKRIVINMDTRFTILYKRFEDGWKIVHIHQSLPNPEQADGEYYPKTLTEQLKVEQKTAETLAKLAERDSLTGLMNYRTLESTFVKEKRQNEWIFIADLDNFKAVNDNYGHMQGNIVLRKVADILKKAVRSHDIVCRMGGDEFIFLCSGVFGEQAAEELMQRIMNHFREAGETICGFMGVSIGGTLIREGETLENALERADFALYNAKAKGKNCWKIAL